MNSSDLPLTSLDLASPPNDALQLLGCHPRLRSLSLRLYSPVPAFAEVLQKQLKLLPELESLSISAPWTSSHSPDCVWVLPSCRSLALTVDHAPACFAPLLETFVCERMLPDD